MRFTSHIELSDWSGQCLLTVRDLELLDFLEDFFVESLGLDAQLVVPQVPAGQPATYQLLFPAGVSASAIHQHLESVGPQEIERIAAINEFTPKSTDGT